MRHSEAFSENTPLILDLSQNVNRMPWSLGIRSVTTSSCLFSFALGRVLKAEEHWAALGFPAMAGQLSERAQKHLVGEAMAPPVIGALAYTLLHSLNGFWEKPRPGL